MSLERILERVARIIAGISDVTGYIAGVAVWLMFVIVLGEIFVRTFLGTSLLFTVEVACWLLIVIVFVGAAWTLKDGGHVQINIVTSRLSERSQQWLMVFLAFLGMVAISMLAPVVYNMLVVKIVGDVRGQTMLRFVVWPVWAAFFIGLVIFALQFCGTMLENILALRRPVPKGRKQE